MIYNQNSDFYRSSLALSVQKRCPHHICDKALRQCVRSGPGATKFGPRVRYIERPVGLIPSTENGPKKMPQEVGCKLDIRSHFP